MKYIFEASDIKAGTLFSITKNDQYMIVRQHISSSENESTRQYAILSLKTGDLTSPWMTQYDLAKYLTGSQAVPMQRSEISVTEIN